MQKIYEPAGWQRYVIHQNYLALLFVANKIEKMRVYEKKDTKVSPKPKNSPLQ